MAEEQDESQKSEEPTHKRLEEAFKKGQVATSREVNSFMMLLVFTFILLWLIPGMMKNIQMEMLPYITQVDDIPADPGGLARILGKTIGDFGLMMAGIFALAVVAAVFASLLQNPFHITMDPIQPKLEKISPLKGWKRLFSLRSIVEFIKGIVKISIVGGVAFIAIWPMFDQLKQLPDREIPVLLDYLAVIAGRMLIGVCIAMFFIAILDYLYQRYEYIKSLRMTKQEIKDEYKQQEGDPLVKQRLRSLRMERARQRMMSAVPTSDVVITNPTHFAVALTYEALSMQAPKVVAKGADLIAFRIREIAKASNVPIVENPPLARALYDSVDLDEEIPLEHYKAVAEVISYVFKLKGKLMLRRKV